jgi:hypothetical protein
MTKFADELYADLMREHGSTLAHTKPPAPGRHIASRRTLLAAGTGFAAVAATAGGLMASGGGAPAYALTTHSNGTVTLDVYQKSGYAGINAKLHQLGDGQVVVVPVEPGCPSLGSLPAPAVPQSGRLTVGGTSSSDGSITVNAHGIPAGDILVVGEQTTANGTQLGAMLTSPPAPSCTSLPSSPPGNGGSGSGGKAG